MFSDHYKQFDLLYSFFHVYFLGLTRPGSLQRWTDSDWMKRTFYIHQYHIQMSMIRANWAGDDKQFEYKFAFFCCCFAFFVFFREGMCIEPIQHVVPIESLLIISNEYTVLLFPLNYAHEVIIILLKPESTHRTNDSTELTTESLTCMTRPVDITFPYIA